MSDQSTKPQDDPWLINYFKNFETMPEVSKADTDWPASVDFQVFSEYLTRDIQEIQERLKNADDQYLYYICEHIFNILDWIKLMVYDAGYPTFGTAIENLFEKHFG